MDFGVLINGGFRNLIQKELSANKTIHGGDIANLKKRLKSNFFFQFEKEKTFDLIS